MGESKGKNLEGIEKLGAYQVIRRHTIAEMQSEGMVLEHRKSGARVFLMSNDDDNKVFFISFCTPPETRTGVAHILEHSVLCGSEKFPLKDPFVELVKGSLNTFLNAMTYSDKTVYPVASCNDKDFQNLMDVYMDAVLHPNIYREKKIFRQEGWHYELASKKEPIVYNGVVYNEMKGVYSSPESCLENYTFRALFPDSCYGKDSGGDPAHIPELTYEEFLDYHRRHYHPSNSYIYLYGDMDMAEKLIWLDREYLCHYDRQERFAVSQQEPFKKPVEREYFYSVSEESQEEHAAYLSVNTAAGGALDAKLYIAFQVLEYALLDAPGAPVKQALIDAGIGEDVYGEYENGILQPYFSVVAKNADKDQKEEFLSVVKGTLRELAEKGMNRKSLRAGINYYEFKYRESDFGSAPRGLMYGLQAMDSWLYGGDPMLHLEYQETFDFLKEQVDKGYFEDLINKYLLDNPFEAVVVLIPEKKLAAREEGRVAEELEDYKASLSEKELDALVEETKALKLYQDTPDPPEVAAKVPLLRREDIKAEAEQFSWKKKMEAGVEVLHHDYFTSGIGYLRVLFKTDTIPQEDLCYVGLLRSVLGCMDTEHYSYADLTSEIFLNSGGLDLSVAPYVNFADPGQFTGVFSANIRVLYDRLDFGFEILEEILLHTDFSDGKRLKEIIQEARSHAKMRLEMAGHSTAISRSASYFSPTSAYNELVGGVSYYRFLERIARNYDGEKEQVIARLREVCAKMFVRSNMLINYTANEEGYAYLPKAVHKLADSLPEQGGRKYPFVHETANRNEGLKISSKVNYVARSGNFRHAGLDYTGALKILQVILNYDYLWLNIRVKGGAYGCMSGFGRSGDSYLASYRDPHLKETNEVFEEIVDYLEQFDPDEREMTKYVIGTISGLDMPLTPFAKGMRGLSAYLTGTTPEMVQQERDEILRASREDIRALAKYVKAILAQGALCAIGSKEAIEADRDMFGEVESLSGAVEIQP